MWASLVLAYGWGLAKKEDVYKEKKMKNEKII